MMNPCYGNGTQNGQIYGVCEEVIAPNSSNSSTHPSSFLYNLSILKDKVHQVQSLASIFMSPEHGHDHHPESIAVAVPTVGTLIQEIIVTASSMMFACQQMSLGPSQNNSDVKLAGVDQRGPLPPLPPPSPSAAFFAVDNWFGDQSYNNGSSTSRNNVNEGEVAQKIGSNGGGADEKDYDVVELEAADLLAKYTHYCHVCGKGFKRDANLRMHMRAHGDEYKSSAALSNPAKGNGGSGAAAAPPRKYSCPQEGCRWNKRHARFTPLKSMICVKNHYKRSHCPKMYVCKRCGRKHFSVLSDLRTHEKHCGDLKWQCTCGTTFSRKDKLMGHVTLFVGHAPAVNSLSKIGKGGH